MNWFSAKTTEEFDRSKPLPFTEELLDFDIVNFKARFIFEGLAENRMAQSAWVRKVGSNYPIEHNLTHDYFRRIHPWIKNNNKADSRNTVWASFRRGYDHVRDVCYGECEDDTSTE